MRLIQFLFVLVFTSSLFAQERTSVDFIKVNAEILPIFDSKEIFGQGTYDFEIKSKVDSVFIDAIDMTFSYVALNGKEIEYSNSGKRLGFGAPSTKGNHELFLKFMAKPKQTVYFVESDSISLSQQIWTQGQGKYTSHWLPSFDDMNEKVEFGLTILADEEYTVIANGMLKDKLVEDGITEWKYDMLDPMSSYLFAFVIGRFDKKELRSASGVPIELYYEPKDSLKVEPTYRYTKEIFDFLEREIGFPYPWQNYKQIPVQDFLYAGMENTGTTIFSNTYVVDSIGYHDKNYVNVNAHELAHQWFGNLVTEQSGEHHWLHEGFATYYAYLAEKHLFGDDHFYWKLYETAKTLNTLSENGDGEALVNPNANSLTFYEKGAWALVMLKEEIGGEAFKHGVEAYLKKHQFQNVTISNFITEMERASGQKLLGFQQKWLESEEFPWLEVKTYLTTKNSSIRMFFASKKSDTFPIDTFKEKTPAPYLLNLMKKFSEKFTEADYDILLGHQQLKVRQRAVQLIDQVPVSLKTKVEALLDDDSYLTKESALYHLWASFPEKRNEYLNQLKNVVGLPNKNIRLLWLTLALVTPEYQPSKKKDFYQELNAYTAPYNHFEVRQLAFQYLNDIKALNDQSLINLIKASQHHVWQFKKSSRNLLRAMVQDTELKNRLLSIKGGLSEQEQIALQKIMEP